MASAIRAGVRSRPSVESSRFARWLVDLRRQGGHSSSCRDAVSQRGIARQEVGKRPPEPRGGSAVESACHRVCAQTDAVEDAAAIDTEPSHEAAARPYRDLAHERESALKCGRVAVCRAHCSRATAGGAQDVRERAPAPQPCLALVRENQRRASAGRARGSLPHATPCDTESAPADRRPRSVPHGTPAACRSAPGSNSSPARRPERPLRSRNRAAPGGSRARRRHRDRAELGAARQPSLGERPAPGDDLIEEVVEINHGPAPQRARWINERPGHAKSSKLVAHREA